jgi:hypothetical protein
MKNPKTIALAGLLLALPFLVLISLLALGIQPSFGPLDAIFNSIDSREGSLIVLGAFLLLLLAFSLNLSLVVRSVRVGAPAAALRYNLPLALLLGVLILVILALIVIDQFPCWVGVPNCD